MDLDFFFIYIFAIRKAVVVILRCFLFSPDVTIFFYPNYDGNDNDDDNNLSRRSVTS